RLADLARDRQVGIASVQAIVQRVALLALAELPLIGNERRLRQCRAGPKPAKRKHRESKNRRAQRPNTPLVLGGERSRMKQARNASGLVPEALHPPALRALDFFPRAGRSRSGESLHVCLSPHGLFGSVN